MGIRRQKIFYTQKQYEDVVSFFENEQENSIPNIAKELGYKENLVNKILRIYFKKRYLK